MKLSDIAERVGGVLEGNGDLEITAVAGLREAARGDISFLANPKYAAQVAGTHASAVIVPQDWDRAGKCALIRVENSDQAFAQVAEFFYEPVPLSPPAVHPTAVVAEGAKLGEGVSIGAHVVIDDGVVVGDGTVIEPQCFIGYKTVIGSNCHFYPQVSTREFTEIGNNVIVHNGTVIGSDGFGYAVQEDGSRTKIPQIGKVVIEDDVEIGANVTIDRARFGKTRIGKGTKIDNLVQIAHNVVVGEHSVMCGQVGVSGSSIIGSKVILAGQAGLAGHLEVGDGAIVGAQSGVMRDVPAKDFVIGSPAMNHLQAKKVIAGTVTLPKLKEKVKKLEAEVAKLSAAKTV
ncbi:UDP-3-O-(3-hydroxymyristoyl)glucosamine N-acyltransferase [Pontiella agarivorans]|uniref:UDP-3-O-acylglucosamine N-acyltransferase n=1 Tax=Pontiella agarivorans TaxID=3038953 RepID=A0ABU5MZD4_9BACT|nr:UDP-3-O-(3-hydroxymyristoyl)glucosamine N-acyltransferase [Pontiella agarivorans]MDZ8119575.1 UDP-3-O-(3-hydroxymyristoyl)glucosamine N-acyltransferase [Pontiella agarivorans]